MVQKVEKSQKTGLTGSEKTFKRSGTLLECLDTIATHRRTLKTLANLLADVGYERNTEADTVRETGGLMVLELEQMAIDLERLKSLAIRGKKADRNRK
jgi:hypothetical protein